jgi:4-hydroxybenzoate polyprenyltransferase
MTVAPAPSASPVARLRTYASFVRFEHTLFSLPLILAGIFSAPGPAMSPARWALVAVAAVGARTAAMALNRLIDRRLDALNPRTRVRELPAGRMKLAEAIALLVASVAAYVLACAALGPWFLRVSIVPLIVFTAYPYMKRFTAFCHFGVGAGLALAPLAGFAAAHPTLRGWMPAVALAVFALCWVSGFDMIYATLDEQFDRAHGVHSMVAWLGRAGALRLSWGLHLAAALALGVAGFLVMGSTAARATDWGILAGVLFAAALGLLYLEQRWAEDVNLAFFKINVWVGFVVLAIVLAARMAAGGFGWR